jgi:signal transduction histidine kinase
MRGQWLIALGAGAWVVGFLAQQRPAVYVVAPLVLVGLLALRRFPLSATLGLAATQGLASALGVPTDNPAGLAPVVLALYTVGRHAAARYGPVAIGAFVVAILVPDLSAPTAAFGLIVCGCMWLFGWVVRRRTESADTSREAAEALRATDLTSVTQRVVAEERRRLATDVMSVIRVAVAEMRAVAERAEVDLDPVRIAAIQQRGAEVVAELRRLLGLLRVHPDGPGADTLPAPRGRAWRLDALVAVGTAILAVSDRMLEPSLASSSGPVRLALGVVMAASLALRRTDTALALTLASAAMGLSIAVAPDLALGISDVVVMVLLAWTAGKSTDGWVWTGLVTFAAVTLFVAWRNSPANVPITVVLIALPLFAGHVWSAQDRAGTESQHQATALAEHHQAEVAEAVTRERLRIARELHDVTSHAVGVMVLQAGAASALRLTSPDAARAALRTVIDAGAHALSELTVLHRVFAEPGPGQDLIESAAPEARLTDTLTALVERLGAAGLAVTLDVEDLALPPEAGSAAYRVVQESLTNAARHAPRARVAVTVGRTAGQLRVQVRDDGGDCAGSDPADPASPGSGFGLVGLSERVRALGGELTAGPVAGGGFAVRAAIPLDATPLVKETAP